MKNALLIYSDKVSNHHAAFRTMRCLVVTFLLMAGLLNYANAQFTVTATSGTLGPTNYTSLTVAGGVFAAINAGTHKGDITVSVTGNSLAETGITVLNKSGVGSSSYTTITIKSDATGGWTISGTPKLIILSGANNVTIDGSKTVNGTTKDLTFTNTAASASPAIIMNTAASNNTVKNCILQSNNSTIPGAANSGVVFMGSAGVLTNNTIRNNDIRNIGTSLTLAVGVIIDNTGSANTNCTITGNRIFNFSNTGLTNRGNSSGFVYSYNEIFETLVFTANITAAISMFSGGNSNWTITGNKIYDLRTSKTPASNITGINISDAQGTCVVSNNMISLGENDNGTINNIRGIFLSAGATNSNVSFYFNSVFIGGTYTSGTAPACTLPLSACFWRNSVTAASVTVLKNNLFVNTRTGGTPNSCPTTQASAKHYAIVNGTSNGTFTSDYNDFYVSATGMYGFNTNVSTAGDLATWSAWNGAAGAGTNGQDVHTLQGSGTGVAAFFTSTSTGNLHLVTNANCAIDGTGIPAGNIQKDIDSLTTGETRHASTPDIGADEFTNTFVPSVNATSNSPVCGGSTISLSSSGQTVYSWGGPNSFSSAIQNPTISNAALANAGTYTVTSTIGSCSVSATTTVIVNIVTGSYTSTNVTCHGNNEGSIDFTASGNGPFTYLWSNNETTSSISGLPAGTYAVVFTDNGGCTNTASITITQPPALAVSAIPTSVSCNGGSDGMLFASVSGGNVPYAYLWSNTATTANVSPLLAGSYSVVVTDNCGATATASTNVTEPAALNANLVVNHVTCNGGSNGSASTSVVGGTAPFTYLWSTGATIQTVSGLSAGSYSVTITDAHNCTLVSPFSVSEPLALSTGCAGANVLCNGGSNGSASVSAVGGTGGYTYLWSNGSTNLSISGLSAGTYLVTVTDVSGCTASCSHVVIQPAALNLSCGGTNNICYNGSIGTASVTPSGGTSPYAYLWSNGSTDNSISGLSAGTYSVTVTDQNGCTNTCSYEVTQPPLLTVTAGYLSPACDGSDLYLTSTVNGGTGTYSYAWSGPNGTINPVANPTITSATNANDAGNYLVTVTDQNGCVAGPSAVEVDVHLTPSGALFANTNADFETTICVGNGGTLMILLGGSGTITGTLWDGVSMTLASYSGTATQIDIPVTPPVGTTIYYLQSMHDQYCAAKAVDIIGVDPITVHVNPSPIASITPSGPTTFCSGGSVTLDAGAGLTYLWSNGATTQTVNVTVSGTYSVTVTNGSNCSATSAVTTVTVNTCNTTALNLKLYIQGYYAFSGSMYPVLLNQTVGASNIETDTILVELRDEFTTSTVVVSAKGLLMTDGTVRSTDGISNFEFPGAYTGTYWIAVKHRNALETWSSSVVSFSTTPTYDFSSAASQALYANQALVDGGLGLYGFYSGDIIPDGFIGIDDVNLTNNDNLAGLFFDYLATDINGDGFVGIDDVNIVNNNNLAGVFFLP